VVDADFGDEQAPGPLDSLALGDAVSLAVVQRLGGGLVRCVTLDRGEPIEPGMSVRYTGRVIERPMGVEVLQQALGVLLEGHEPGRSVVETGIKAVDLLCPIPSAGVVGLYGPAGAGKLVMLGELIHRLRQGDYPLALLDFTQADTVPTLPTDVSRPVDSGRVDTVYLPVGDAASPHSAAVQQARDAIQGAIYLSREMALSGLYPAIDPLVTWSSLLTADVVGPEHVEVAQQVRDRLSAAPDSESARRLRLFLTQPFFTTEEYTKLPGEYVSLQQTLEGCRAILSGSMDQLPADAFHFTGTLDQVHRKAKR
jgi:F0F1-type ATP synthase beta subunit